MDQKTPAAEKLPTLNFIRDVPASTDAFGHTRVAKALATAIHTDKDLKVIGLLGAWGSGKTTVVTLAKAELKKTEDIDTHVFTYDAWLHQSDPPRRSFLETLVKFLLTRNVGLSRDKWQARLDELNRRVEETDTTSTPTLTGTGRAALFLLLLLPFGTQFISHDWIKDIFTKGAETYVYVAVFGGTAILLLPLLFAFGLYLWWRPSWNPLTGKKFFSWTNLYQNKPPHEHDSILSLVMNKEVIFFGDGEPDIYAAVNSSNINMVALDPDWQRSIAAIYFGCKPDVAMQILIERRLRTAIDERKPEEFKTLAAMPGFETVLRRILDLYANGDIADPAVVLNAAELLDTLNPPSQPWVRYAWKSIRAAYQKPTSWQKLRVEDAPSFERLMAHSDAQQGKLMLAALAEKLATINEALTTQPEFGKNFANLCLAASKTAVAAQSALPDILVPGSLPLFMAVVAACKADAPLVSALKTKASNDEIIAELSNNLADPTAAPLVEVKVRALMGRKPALPWAAFVNAAGTMVQDREASFAGFRPAVECLGLLRKTEKTAEVRIKALLDSGALVAKLNEAHSQKRLNVEAPLLAMLLMKSPSFDPPGGQTWQALLTDRPELVGLVDLALLEFYGPDNIDVLVKHATTNNSTSALIQALVSLRVKAKRMGSLGADRIVPELPLYLSYIEPSLQPQFIRDLAASEDLWKDIEAKTLDDNTIRVLTELIKSGSGYDGKARGALEKKLKAVTSEAWTAALNSNQEPLPIATLLHETTGKAFHLGTTFFDVLQASIAPLLANDNGAFRVRWFKALDLVSPNSRVTLLKDVRGRIVLGTDVGALPAFLRVGGDALLVDGDFAGEADGAVRKIVLPLLGNADGMTWLINSAANLRKWMTDCDKSTRESLGERLTELYGSADNAAKAQLDKLGNEWGFNLEAKESERDSSAETTS